MNADDVGLTDQDVRTPIRNLVVNDPEPVIIWDIGNYFDVFFALERTLLDYWLSHPEMKDKEVIAAFRGLIRSFDDHRDGTLASELSNGVKAILILGRRNQRILTLGEVVSCVRFLTRIAETHQSPDGIGYLKWVRAFFEGRMPVTDEEIDEYIREEES